MKPGLAMKPYGQEKACNGATGNNQGPRLEYSDSQIQKLRVEAFIILVHPRNFKGGIGSLFDPCVNAMGRQPC